MSGERRGTNSAQQESGIRPRIPLAILGPRDVGVGPACGLGRNAEPGEGRVLAAGMGLRRDLSGEAGLWVRNQQESVVVSDGAGVLRVPATMDLLGVRVKPDASSS